MAHLPWKLRLEPQADQARSLHVEPGKRMASMPWQRILRPLGRSGGLHCQRVVGQRFEFQGCVLLSLAEQENLINSGGQMDGVWSCVECVSYSCNMLQQQGEDERQLMVALGSHD